MARYTTKQRDLGEILPSPGVSLLCRRAICRLKEGGMISFARISGPDRAGEGHQAVGSGTS